MSYRVSVENTQIFGNNESYDLWDEFVKSQGIEIDEDGCYDGEITDIQGMFAVIDKITRKIINDRHEEILRGETNYEGEPLKEITDLSGSMWLKDNYPLLMFNQQMIENAYCFLPYQVYKAVENKIERTKQIYTKDGVDWICCTYKVKDGETINVHAG